MQNMNQAPRAPQHTQYDYPTDRVIDYVETIKQKLNYWRNKHIENVMAFHESLKRREEDPTQVIPTERGDLSITDICEIRVYPAQESKAHVEVLTEMLEEAEQAKDSDAQETKLSSRWSKETLVAPEKLIPSPIKGDDVEGDKKVEEKK